MAMTEAEYLAKASDLTTTEDALQALWDEVGVWGFPLGNSVGRSIQKAIVQNPNLPLSLVRECFGELAPAFASNPALPLLSLENPNLAGNAPEETVLRLLKRAEIPAVIVEILCRHETRAIADAARLHVMLNPIVAEDKVREELAILPTGGRKSLKRIHDLGEVPGWLAEYHELGERQKDIPIEHLSGSATGLVIVLGIATTDYPVGLHNAALDSRWFQRLGAALNPRLTEKDRKRLVDDANAIVRAVARDTGLRDRIMENDR